MDVDRKQAFFGERSSFCDPDLTGITVNAALVFSIVFALLQGVVEGPRGSIQGTVFDEKGKPLANAIVYALPEQNKSTQIQVRTFTDAQGKFLLRDIPLGKVSVDAFKESDGYPYNYFPFFNPETRSQPQVEVTSPEVPVQLDIKLAPKAGLLSLNVKDQRGKAIDGSIELTFSRSGLREDFRVIVTAQNTILVPALPFRFSVTAKGYQPWQSGLISLRSNELLKVDVKLEPISESENRR